MTQSEQRRKSWGKQIPLPGEHFGKRETHVRNEAAINLHRQKRGAELDRRSVAKFVRERTALYNALSEAGVHLMRQEFGELAAEWRDLDTRTAIAAEFTDDERKVAFERMDAIKQRAATIRRQIAPMQPMIKRYYFLDGALKEHMLAHQRSTLETRQKQDSVKECREYAMLIQERWAALGYKHEWLNKKGKRVVDKVQFDVMYSTPTNIALKIKVSTRAMFGAKSALPYLTKAADLINPDTCREITAAIQLPVRGLMDDQIGCWILIDRVGVRDGIPEYIHYDQIMERYPEADREEIPICIGVTNNSELVWIKLGDEKTSHILIGGETGGGKSNTLNTIICQLLETQSPEHVRLAFVDLKEGVEFQHYEDMPHTLGITGSGEKIVTTIDGVDELMQSVNQKMIERYRMIKAMRSIEVKDINSYNRIQVEAGNPPLPHIFVVFDEFASLQEHKERKADIMMKVQQIVNKGRAAGIHLIVCTQTPEVAVIPGPLKNNMPVRIAAPMPTASASMTILGTGDAAELPTLTRGRMFMKIGMLRQQIQMPHTDSVALGRALKHGLQWYEKVAQLKLPSLEELPAADMSTRASFTVDDLIELVIENLGGNLGARPIFEVVKGMTALSFGDVKKLVDQLKLGDQLEYRGRIYIVKTRKGRGKMIVPVGAHETGDEPIIPHDSGEQPIAFEGEPEEEAPASVESEQQPDEDDYDDEEDEPNV